MQSKIDVRRLAQEVFEDAIELYNQEMNDFKPKVHGAINDADALIVIITESIECLRRHSENFTIELVHKVVDDLENRLKSSGN